MKGILDTAWPVSRGPQFKNEVINLDFSVHNKLSAHNIIKY